MSPSSSIWRRWQTLWFSTFAATPPQPFPFPKYDQVLIPGFPYGGMEHAGATFFNEDAILFRTVPTVNDYNRRSETVLHELAHQWFGDLVTMRWFDDLWLKEGSRSKSATNIFAAACGFFYGNMLTGMPNGAI